MNFIFNEQYFIYAVPATYEAERAWNEHLRRMQEIERRYFSFPLPSVKAMRIYEMLKVTVIF